METGGRVRTRGKQDSKEWQAHSVQGREVQELKTGVQHSGCSTAGGPQRSRESVCTWPHFAGSLGGLCGLMVSAQTCVHSDRQ